MHQTTEFPEVVVVGGGPVGCFAALKLAKLGTRVTLFEEHEAFGRPSHCAGHVSIRSLTSLGLYPLNKRIIENTFSKANFYSPSGFRFSIELANPVTCSINREAFDKYVAEKAEAAGAALHLKSPVQSLILRNGVVQGVKVKQKENIEKILPARIVIDAEGISSRILRQTGISGFDREKLVYAVEAEVERVKDLPLDTVEVFLGRAYAPGFYAWLIPRSDGTAKVGLATKTGNPRKFLRTLMAKHPVASKKLARSKIIHMAFHPITIGGPIAITYCSGFLAVGDVASQVKPTTGGGLVLGLTCARIAAEVAHEAIQRNNVSSNFLALYKKRCIDTMGFDTGVMLRARQFFDRLPDKKVDEILRFFTRIGLDKNLDRVNEIDFQGRLLLRMLPKPTVLVALAYLLKSYLSANT